MNIHELKRHPELFAKAHQNYCDEGPDYDWWDSTVEDIKSKWGEKKLDVDRVYFDLHERYATFEGVMRTKDFLKMQGLEDTHLALAALHADRNSATLKAYTSQRCNLQRAEINDTDAYSLQYQTPPCGIFEGMDEDEWQELVGRELDSISAEWEQFCKDAAWEMLRQFEDEYAYLTSEEAFVEWAGANEVEFDFDEDEVGGE